VGVMRENTRAELSAHPPYRRQVTDEIGWSRVEANRIRFDWRIGWSRSLDRISELKDELYRDVQGLPQMQRWWR
jgi:hypothetical protein